MLTLIKIHTPEIWLSILTLILIPYSIMVIKHKRIDNIEQQQESIYFAEAVQNQLIESGQNTFM